MDDERRFLFDLKGWLLMPGVLSEADCAAVRAHILAGGSPFTGPAQALLDHPAVVEVLDDLLADWPSNDEAYQFRCENSFATIRHKGWTTRDTNVPHVVLPPHKGGPMTYHCRNGRIYAGLTRVVWELNPVHRGMGGTLFLSGSHKTDLPFPPSVRAVDNALLESYECPAGSVFIFSESLLHASSQWRDPDHDRVAIFSAYNSLWAQWHRLHLDHDIIASMPERRRSLFRGVYAMDFKADSPTSGPNVRYSELNRAL